MTRATLTAALPPLPSTPQGSIINKWNAKRAEAEEEAAFENEESRPQSLHELEAAKKARLSEWKASLTSAETERNINFAPVVGDWRARVAQARARK